MTISRSATAGASASSTRARTTCPRAAGRSYGASEPPPIKTCSYLPRHRVPTGDKHDGPAGPGSSSSLRWGPGCRTEGIVHRSYGWKAHPIRGYRGRRSGRTRPPSRLRRVSFPEVRMRRLRRSEGLRRLVRETRVAPADLVQPLFVVSGSGVDRPIPSLPGPAPRLRRTSQPPWLPRPRPAVSAGCCCSACPIARTSRDLRPGTTPARCRARSARSARRPQDFPVMTDVCLCQYTSHGACGVLREGEVDNDATLPLLARVARLPRARGRRRRRALGHDGRPRGRAARARSTARASRASRSSPTAPSSPRPSTARSATPPARRPSPATARATSSTPPTRARPCARPCSTPPRAPTR